LEIIKEI